MAESFVARLEAMVDRLAAVDRQLLDPETARQGAVCAALMRERGRLAKVVEPYLAWKRACARLEESRAVLSDATADAELKQLAADEISAIEQEVARLREEVKRAFIRDEGAPERNVIMEIRAGTGGEEAALFAADLCRMYSRFAESRGWRVTQLDARPTDLGGFREVTLSIEGEGAYRALRLESGGHRVQRVPITESQGRIHTSLVTVAVLPEAEELDVQINPADIEMSFFRASGPGGQKVNKTSSAVRLVHLPTGIEASCQDSPSQHKNRAAAMRVLRARLFEHFRSLQKAARDEERRTQIGSGDRNERIRTYNFPQDRVTDHRIGLTVHNLPRILDGDLEPIIRALEEYEIAQREKGLDLP